MENLLMVISLVILLVLGAGGMFFNPPTKQNDGPAGAIGSIMKHSEDDSFGLFTEIPTLLADKNNDGPAGPIDGPGSLA